MLYRTRTIRYVPDVAREEFVNIGVIVVGERPGDVAVRTLDAVSQIPEIGGPRDVALQAAQRIQRELVSFASDPGQLELDERSTVRSRLALMARNAYNMIQYGEERVADGTSAQSLADFLFDHLVVRDEPTRRMRRLPRLRQDILTAYHEMPEVSPLVQRRPILDAGARSGGVDLAVVGEEVYELNSAFSFQGQPTRQAQERVDAWSFRMERLRNDGGQLTLQSGRTLPVHDDIMIAAIVEMPRTSRQEELYQEVTAPWPSLGITEVTRDQLGIHARELEARLSAA